MSAEYEPRVARREQTVAVRGVDYRVHEWGEPDAPVFIYLHGWGDCAPSFQFVVDALSGTHRVIAADWRGFGDSGHNSSAYWFPDYLADLDALLLALDIDEPVSIVGHSMGANVAALYAGIFPEKVAAFINIEGFGLPESNPEDAPERYRGWVTATRQRQHHPGYPSTAMLISRIRQRSPRISDARADYVARCWTREVAGGLRELKADMAHRWPNAVLYRRAEALACWRQVSAPVLLICGADSDFREGLLDWHEPTTCPIPGTRVVTIEDAGHMLHFEQPEQLAAHIEEFLAAKQS